MTTTPHNPDPAHHLARAAELARVADRKITDGIWEGGDTEFVRTVIELAALHIQLANAAASTPFVVRAQFDNGVRIGTAVEPRPECPYPHLRHAPHDGCPGALMADPLAEQQKRGEL